MGLRLVGCGVLCQLVGVWARGPDDHDGTGGGDLGHSKGTTHTWIDVHKDVCRYIRMCIQGKGRDKPVQWLIAGRGQSALTCRALCVSVCVCVLGVVVCL